MHRRLRPEVVKAVKTRHTLWVVTVVTFVLGVVPLILSLILSFAGMKTMYVVSDSMFPAFKRGDLVIGAKNFNSLGKGDVIAFNTEWFPDGLVTHRIADIVDSSSDGYSQDFQRFVFLSETAEIFTKGDNNVEMDSQPIVLSDVDSEIVGVVPFAGYYVNSKVIGILLGVFFGSSLLSAFRWEIFYKKDGVSVS